MASRRSWLAGRSRLALALALVATLGAAPAASAKPFDIKVDLEVDLPVVGGAALAWIVSEGAKSSLAPGDCRWCAHAGVAGAPLDLNGVDRGVRDALRWSNTELASNLSNLSAFVLAPMAALGLTAIGARNAGEGRTFWTDAVVIVETVALAALLNQVVKFAAGRERPYRAALDDSGRAQPDSDGNLSFFSGHTTLAFALVVSSATLATLRERSIAPALWAVGLPLAAAAGWLRIAADRHYFTDVLVGALVGSAFGFLVPFLHRTSLEAAAGEKRAWSLTPGLGGASFALVW